MNTRGYLAAFDRRLQEFAGIIVRSSIQREIDANLGVGFISGRITFVDGSVLEFSEQLPMTRCKFRIHYMDASANLIARWDSAPHHQTLATFPFHKHTPQGIEAYPAITLLEALDEIIKGLKA